MEFPHFLLLRAARSHAGREIRSRRNERTEPVRLGPAYLACSQFVTEKIEAISRVSDSSHHSLFGFSVLFLFFLPFSFSLFGCLFAGFLHRNVKASVLGVLHYCGSDSARWIFHDSMYFVSALAPLVFDNLPVSLLQISDMHKQHNLLRLQLLYLFVFLLSFSSFSYVPFLALLSRIDPD